MLGKACQVESWWVSGLFSFKVFRAFEWARTKRRDLEIPPTRKLNEASGFGKNQNQRYKAYKGFKSTVFMPCGMNRGMNALGHSPPPTRKLGVLIFLDIFYFFWYAADDALQYHWIGRVLLRPVIKPLRRIAPLNHNFS